MPAQVIARDIMSTHVIALHADTLLYTAMAQLLDANISGAPVVDDTGKLIGILSQRDCMRVALTNLIDDGRAGCVRDYMQTKVVTLVPETDLVSLATFFHENTFRRAPIVEDGELVGIISRGDVLRRMHAVIGEARTEPPQTGSLITNASTTDAVGPITNQRFTGS